jgi:hypothetical protein
VYWRCPINLVPIRIIRKSQIISIPLSFVCGVPKSVGLPELALSIFPLEPVEPFIPSQPFGLFGVAEPFGFVGVFGLSNDFI